MQNPFIHQLAAEFDGLSDHLDTLQIKETGELPSWFETTALANASVGLSGLALARLADGGAAPSVEVNSRFASLWFGMSIQPQGWELPPIWDTIAGDYACKDGWIKLHTNARHHRKAACSVLGDHDDKQAIAKSVAHWDGEALETAIVEAGGCAAFMRSIDDWQQHPTGKAIAREPIVHWTKRSKVDADPWTAPADRPLSGIRILDLTRVLAGPVAGRFLAGFDAEVLRIDPPGWDEGAVIPEVVLGKSCATLNLKTEAGIERLTTLLRTADVLLHGYRADALAGLGFSEEDLAEINPRLINVRLNAYGWSGPWVNRRGYDSLVQMNSGIANYGMAMAKSDVPTPLPVQALDHATGYLLATSVLHALRMRRETGTVLSAKLSLAKTANVLSQHRLSRINEAMPPLGEADIDPHVENTDWGPARRVRFPLEIEGIPHAWDHPARRLHTSKPIWQQ
ncbi:MAG: CoA transferase [Pseudomonadota bacterium]